MDVRFRVGGFGLSNGFCKVLKFISGIFDIWLSKLVLVFVFFKFVEGFEFVKLIKGRLLFVIFL